MTTIIETELSRCPAAVTEQRLTNHFQNLLESEMFDTMTHKERSDLYFEFRSLIEFKKKLENEFSKDPSTE